MKIEMQTTLAGPHGCWPAGAVLTVGTDVTEAQAWAYMHAGFAREVSDTVLTETADVAPPETAMKKEWGKGRGARGR